MAELEFKVGDAVFVSGTIYQSANGTLTFGEAPKTVSKIKRTAPKGAHPYAIEDIYGWFDIKSVKKALDLQVGDKVQVIKSLSYHNKRLDLKYKDYVITNLDGDKATITHNNVQTVIVNAYNLEKLS